MHRLTTLAEEDESFDEPLINMNDHSTSMSSASSPTRAETKVLIIGGGGTFGSSTALHLLRSGYTPQNITLLDVYPIPSKQSAGNDLNKIFGVWSMDEISVRLTYEAREMWVGDELFKPFFNGTGGVS